LLALNSPNGFSNTTTADQNGNWNQTTTWDCSIVPGCCDTIIIPAGITVTITVMADLTACPSTIVYIYGTLTFQTGKKLNLSDSSIVYIEPGGLLTGANGGGSSDWITLNGEPYWKAGDGPLPGPAILCQYCTLPIEVLNFNIEFSEGVVNISWETASELNNDYFEVQRSIDGIQWQSIATLNGSGNSSSSVFYREQDSSPLRGLSYYRLKQVDFNGTFSFSETISISTPQTSIDQEILVLWAGLETNQNIAIYFTESVNGPTDIIVASPDGSIIYSRSHQLTGEDWIVISIDHSLSFGTYIIKVNQQIAKVFFL